MTRQIMTPPGTDPEESVNELAGIGGVLCDDILVREEKVTTYLPKDRIDAARELGGVTIEVLEEYEQEFLIVATPTDG